MRASRMTLYAAWSTNRLAVRAGWRVREETLRKPRLLVIGPTPPPVYGVAVAIQALLASSALRERFDVAHHDTSDRRQTVNFGKLDAVNVWLALVHGIGFLLLLARVKPQLVYVPISVGLLGYLRDCLFLIPLRLLGTPTVIHLQGSEFRRFHQQSAFWIRWLIRFSLSRVRLAIVLTEGSRAQLHGLVPEARIAVVQYGLRDFWCQTPRDPDQREVRALFMATLQPSKGLFVALEAAIEALSEIPELRACFAGQWSDGRVRSRALEMVRAAGVQSRVAFPGVIVGAAKERLLLETDVFLFPTMHHEGQPLVLLEAMCAGIPIVTTDRGGIVETIEDSECGFIVASGDPHAAAEKLVLLARDPDLRQRMGQSGRRRYLQHFTEAASNRLFADQLQRALEGA